MVNLWDQWWNQIPEGKLRGLSEIGITTHWIILQYTIGLITLAVVLEIYATWKRNKDIMEMAKVLSRVAIVNFAVGAATGSMSEFGLLLFWPGFLELVGKYYFIPLYLEVFAFFLEVIFVYMYYYTWERVGPKFHIFVGILGTLGILLSAILIMSVNTLMSYPPGIQAVYDPVTMQWQEPQYLLYIPAGAVIPSGINYVAKGNNQILISSSELRKIIDQDPELYRQILGETVRQKGIWWIVFQSPGVAVNALHAIFASLVVTSFTVLGIYSWRFMHVKEEKKPYYLEGMRTFSVVGTVTLVIQGIIGHEVALNAIKYNPEKISALEGKSSSIPSISDLPGVDPVLRILSFGTDWKRKHLPSYDSIGSDDYKPPLILHYFYYTKIMLATALFGLSVVLLYYLFWKKQTPEWLMRITYSTPFVVQLISNFGWISREAGRKPWTIYGVLKVDEAARQDPISLWFIIGVIIYCIVLLGGLAAIMWYLFKLKEE